MADAEGFCGKSLAKKRRKIEERLTRKSRRYVEAAASIAKSDTSSVTDKGVGPIVYESRWDTMGHKGPEMVNKTRVDAGLTGVSRLNARNDAWKTDLGPGNHGKT